MLVWHPSKTATTCGKPGVSSRSVVLLDTPSLDYISINRVIRFPKFALYVVWTIMQSVGFPRQVN